MAWCDEERLMGEGRKRDGIGRMEDHREEGRGGWKRAEEGGGGPRGGREEARCKVRHKGREARKGTEAAGKPVKHSEERGSAGQVMRGDSDD